MRIILTIIYLVFKNYIFYNLLKSSQISRVMTMILYFGQMVISIFLNNIFWKDESHSLAEAIPMIVNIEFFFVMLFFLMKLQIKLTNSIANRMNITHPFARIIEFRNDFISLSKFYLFISGLEIILIWLVLKNAA